MTQCSERISALTSRSHMLITGGPGSGKTHFAVEKALYLADQFVMPDEQVLMLSFANASVARVVENLVHEQRATMDQRRRIEILTYHSFCWQVLQGYGYLADLPTQLYIHPAPLDNVVLAQIRHAHKNKRGDENKDENEEMQKSKKEKEEQALLDLGRSTGRISFDLFAPLVADIFCRSHRIRTSISEIYPVIILDEFQDTDDSQWDLIKELGKSSQLVALADPEQQIYRFRGANPQRLTHFSEQYDPLRVCFETKNYRSADTDILQFGNEMLTSTFSKQNYVGIRVAEYSKKLGSPSLVFLNEIVNAINRLTAEGVDGWSVGVMVRSRDQVQKMSEFLSSPPDGRAPIPHYAKVDWGSTTLSAGVVIALMRDGGRDGYSEFIEALIRYFLGRNKERPTKKDIDTADSIKKSYDKWCEKVALVESSVPTGVAGKLYLVYNQVAGMELWGDPKRDWMKVFLKLREVEDARIERLAKDLGSQCLTEIDAELEQRIERVWESTHSYEKLDAVLQNSLVEQQVDDDIDVEQGVIVLNWHRAKGKQFDEVIILDGDPLQEAGAKYSERVVSMNDQNRISDEIRFAFRVSITRAKKRATIFTPMGDKCVLLP